MNIITIFILLPSIMEYIVDPVVDPFTLDEQGKYVFNIPHEIELAYAGTFGDHISIYGDMIYFQDDFGSSSLTTWLALKFRAQFENLFGPENLFNIAVGNVGVHTIGLYTARAEASLPIQPYSMYSWAMPTPMQDQEVFLFQ